MRVKSNNIYSRSTLKLAQYECCHVLHLSILEYMPHSVCSAHSSIRRLTYLSTFSLMVRCKPRPNASMASLYALCCRAVSPGLDHPFYDSGARLHSASTNSRACPSHPSRRWLNAIWSSASRDNSLWGMMYRRGVSISCCPCSAWK